MLLSIVFLLVKLHHCCLLTVHHVHPRLVFELFVGRWCMLALKSWILRGWAAAFVRGVDVCSTLFLSTSSSSRHAKLLSKVLMFDRCLSSPSLTSWRQRRRRQSSSPSTCFRVVDQRWFVDNSLRPWCSIIWWFAFWLWFIFCHSIHMPLRLEALQSTPRL